MWEKLEWQKPVFSTVAFHQVPVWVEEHAPVAVDACDPDRGAGGLQPGAQAQLLRLLLGVVPDEEPNVVALQNPSGQLTKSSSHLRGIHDPVVEIRRAASGDHEVGEAEGDGGVVLPHQRGVDLLLQVLLRLTKTLREDETVEQQGKPTLDHTIMKNMI